MAGAFTPVNLLFSALFNFQDIHLLHDIVRRFRLISFIKASPYNLKSHHPDSIAHNFIYILYIRMDVSHTRETLFYIMEVYR